MENGATCSRPGCNLPRGTRIGPNAVTIPRTTCSHSCVVWMARAREALKTEDVKEAAELLRLVEKLDARTDARQIVPGLYARKGGRAALRARES